MQMNREVYFGYNPTINIKRSRFDMSYRVKNAFNAGDLVPLGKPIRVLPGDTFKVRSNNFIRMSPTIDVPLDDIVADIWWFFCPSRLVWTHWREFCGENTQDPWTSTTTYRIPHIKLVTAGGSAISIGANTILSHMGIPLNNHITSGGTDVCSVSALPVRCYCLIWNEFYRSESVQYPVLFSTGDSDITYTSTTLSNYGNSAYGCGLLPVNRFHDYFSSCLPQAQFGDPVRLPVNSDMSNSSGAFAVKTSSLYSSVSLYVPSTAGGNITTQAAPASAGNLALGPNALGTIDEFRIAYLAQRYLWQLGTYGTRYIEMIKGFFGVTAPDYMLQRPILLGTTRFNINVSPVVQTSASEDTTFDGQSYSQSKGSISGYSATRHDSDLFTHSFVEHGYLIPLVAVRTHRSYNQGISKQWFERDFLDLYNPIFASIGSQPVLTKYLYAGDSTHSVAVDDVFGFNEAWAEWRYNEDLITGMMKQTSYFRPWTFADEYPSKPVLSSGWLPEGKSNLDRTLYITSSDTVPQFFGDFYIDMIAIRPMPLHSVPGISPHL